MIFEEDVRLAQDEGYSEQTDRYVGNPKTLPHPPRYLVKLEQLEPLHNHGTQTKPWKQPYIYSQSSFIRPAEVIGAH